MSKSENSIAYGRVEERLNVITHCVGALLAVVGFVFLLMQAIANKLGSLEIASVWIYGACLVIMFAMSSIYHAQPVDKTRRVVFRRFDHCSIALLIAGTYAPYMIIGLQGTWGLVIEIIELVLCVILIVLNSINVQKFRKFSLISYVVMGWICMIALIPLVKNIGVLAFVFMVAGGVFYTGGIVFYKIKRIPLNHAIWHVCVLLAAAFLYVSIFIIV